MIYSIQPWFEPSPFPFIKAEFDLKFGDEILFVEREGFDQRGRGIV